MRWEILAILALVLAGCVTEKTSEKQVLNETIQEQPTQETQIVNENKPMELALNLRDQEGGLRITLEKVYIKNSELYAEVYGEKLLKELQVPKATEFSAYIYHGSGQLQDLKICGLNIIDEEHWHGKYCESLAKMDDEIFNDKIYFVMSTQRRDDLKENFIRVVGNKPWTYTMQTNFKDTFIKK